MVSKREQKRLDEEAALEEQRLLDEVAELDEENNGGDSEETNEETNETAPAPRPEGDRAESGRIGAEDNNLKKLKVRLPDGVNMRNPQTGQLIKDPKENKDLKEVELEVPNDVFWQRRINAGDVEWLDAPKGYKYQKTHRLAK